MSGDNVEPGETMGAGGMGECECKGEGRFACKQRHRRIRVEAPHHSTTNSYASCILFLRPLGLSILNHLYQYQIYLPKNPLIRRTSLSAKYEKIYCISMAGYLPTRFQ